MKEAELTNQKCLKPSLVRPSWVSLRSIYKLVDLSVSPHADSEAEVRNVLEKEMDMDRALVEKIKIKSCKVMSHRSLPAHRAGEIRAGKFQVEFGLIDDRDMISSYAIHLKGKASIDVVVPDSLKVTRTRLEHYAFKFRQCSKELAGNDKSQIARTQIRLDNMSENVLLGIRRTKESKWEFTTWDNRPPLPGEAERSDTSEEEDIIPKV